VDQKVANVKMTANYLIVTCWIDFIYLL